MDDGFTMRRMTRAELDTAVEWAAAEGWNPGLGDATAFWAADPEGFFVGELDGELVASISIVRYADRRSFLGFYIVRPDQRGRGFGWRLWEFARREVADAVNGTGLDGVIDQVEAYRRSGFVLAHRNVRYVAANPAHASRCRLGPLGAGRSRAVHAAPTWPTSSTTTPACSDAGGPSSSRPGSPKTGSECPRRTGGGTDHRIRRHPPGHGGVPREPALRRDDRHRGEPARRAARNGACGRAGRRRRPGRQRRCRAARHRALDDARVRDRPHVRGRRARHRLAPSASASPRSSSADLDRVLGDPRGRHVAAASADERRCRHAADTTTRPTDAATPDRHCGSVRRRGSRRRCQRRPAAHGRPPCGQRGLRTLRPCPSTAPPRTRARSPARTCCPRHPSPSPAGRSTRPRRAPAASRCTSRGTAARPGS